MDGMTIVLSVVLCSADSLSCVQVPTSQHAFATPGDCQLQRERMRAELDGVYPAYPEAMARCRYRLNSEREAAAGTAPSPSDRLEDALGIADRLTFDDEALERIKVAARKTDRLRRSPDHPVQSVRTVTVDYLERPSASVLLGIPAEQDSASAEPPRWSAR